MANYQHANQRVRDAYKTYLGREANDDLEVNTHLGGGRQFEDRNVNYAVNQIRNSPEAQAYASNKPAMGPYAGEAVPGGGALRGPVARPPAGTPAPGYGAPQAPGALAGQRPAGGSNNDYWNRPAEQQYADYTKILRGQGVEPAPFDQWSQGLEQSRAFFNAHGMREFMGAAGGASGGNVASALLNSGRVLNAQGATSPRTPDEALAQVSERNRVQPREGDTPAMQMLRQAYQSALGREASDAEILSHLGGGRRRGDLQFARRGIQTIFESPEYRTRVGSTISDGMTRSELNDLIASIDPDWYRV